MGDLIKELPAAWGVTGTLRFELRLPEESPSNNTIKDMHFHAYKHLRRRFRYLVLAALEGKRPVAPLPRSLLVVRRYCAGYLDWDNALGGLKPILDCLVAPTARNPDGLGLVLDDSPRSMPFPPFMEQIKAKRGEGHPEILVFEVPADSRARNKRVAA